ncbi:MAG: hypothetical protein RR139_09415 [Lachnospiraceae bacterium]
MGDRSIKKETKKMKKSDKQTLNTSASSAPRPMTAQPELVKKTKKVK